MVHDNIEEQAFFIGVVEGTSQDKNGNPIAYLKPLYRAACSGRWVDKLSDEERHELFPTLGLLIWFHARNEAQRGSLWSFAVQETPELLSGQERKYTFHVVDGTAKEVREILDLWDTGITADDIRIEVQDIVLSIHAVAKFVFARIDEQHVVGPLPMVYSDGDLVFDNTQKCDALPVVRMHDPSVCTTPVVIDGMKRILLGHDDILSRTSHRQDWSPDDEVMRAAIKYIKKDTSQLTPQTDLQLTDARIRESVAKRLVEGDALDLRVQRLTRADALLAEIGNEETLIHAISHNLLELPAVQQIITSKTQQVIDAHTIQLAALRAKAEEEAALLIESATAKAAIQRATAQDEVKALRNEAGGLRQQSEELLDALRVKVEEKVSQPIHAVADLLIARALLGQRDEGQTVTQGATICEPPMAECINEPDLFKQQLTSISRHAITPLAMANELHSAFLVDAFPILQGEAALSVVESYASCVTGGDFHWVPISLTMIDAKVLFGDGHTTMLARAFAQATAYPDRLFIVLFDGINKAPVESYLFPLLACYKHRYRRHPLYRLEVPCASTGIVELMSWPKNLLAAGTIVEGVVTLPLPETIWQQAIPLTDTSSLVHPQRDDLPEGLATAVRYQDWIQWQREVATPTLANDGIPPLWAQYRVAYEQWFDETPAIPKKIGGADTPDDDRHGSAFGEINET